MHNIGTYSPTAQSFLQETERSPETSQTEDPSTELSSEPASDTEDASESASAEMPDTEAASESEAPSEHYMETELPDSPIETEEADSEDSAKGSIMVEYADGSPLANTGDAASELMADVRLLVQFQPNYLDLTEVSLSWEHLEEELTSMTEGYSGNWSVYVKNLSNGEVISINENPMESARPDQAFYHGGSYGADS